MIYLSAMLLYLLLTTVNLCAYSPFLNFRPPIQVNDIAIGESYVWAASQGGLIRIIPSETKGTLFFAADDFPDLQLTAIACDNDGTLWIGTKRGYLYRRSPKGYQTIYTSYVTSDTSKVWEINDIYLYKKYLIIGSSQGCSIFDTNKKNVVQNATLFGDFNSPIVYSATVYRDTLFLGCLEGVAKLNIAGDLIETQNFIDNSIWTTIKLNKEIKSLPVYNDTVVFMPEVSGVYHDSLLYGYNIEHPDGSSEHYIYHDTTEWSEFNSQVISIAVGNNGDCWFGTAEDYLFHWDGHKKKQHYVDGMTFGSITRVYVARDSRVWYTPELRKDALPWWQGIAAYYNEKWYLYREGHPKSFGKVGDGIDLIGIAEDPFGNMWFGTNGACIKKYNPSNDRWDGFYIGTGANSTFQYKKENKGMNWGKCDAIARDSSDYMWFAAWKSDSGSIICYDPSTKLPTDKEYDNSPSGTTYPPDSTYRYFFSKESDYHLKEPKFINVDAAGSIFLGSKDPDNGRVIVFRYNENPLKEGITEPVYDRSFGNVFDMYSTEDSCTWILSLQGMHHFEYSRSFTPIVRKVSASREAAGILDNLNCMEVEDFYYSTRTDEKTDITYNTTEMVVWGGTSQDGVAKIYMHKIRNSIGQTDSIGIDSVITFKEENGLVSNRVTYMDLDRSKGQLWIATREGFSRYSIGHSFVKLQDNAGMYAYPNPFIKSRHKQIVFDNCAPGSQISVYTVDGRLVAHIVDRGNNVEKTTNEWIYIWHPDGKLIPGVYFYTAKKQQIYEQQKDKGAVGKLLIIP